MNFDFTAEQSALRDTVRGYLSRSDDPQWSVLAGQLGLAGIAVPERCGGAGASLVEVAVVVEEAGRALLCLPYLSTVAAAAAVEADLAGDLLAGIASGATVAVLALDGPATARRDGAGYRLDGVKRHVLDGGHADVAVVAADCDGRPGLYAVRAGDLDCQAHPTLDQTRGQATLTLAGSPGVLAGADPHAVGRAVDLVRALLAVESLGVAGASLAMTVAHLRDRRQFGVALAAFQALRHRVADLAVAVQAATSAAWYAVRVADTGEFPVAAPLAKLCATETAYAVTAESIQLHGGIGFTWEHPAHRYFKRATANRLLYGDPVALRRLVGARAGI
jgi:alkylation response protein AidB-like acyl-CoA dehydrogenase